VEQSQSEIPGGCNFVGWFDIGQSQVQFADAFESAGWKVAAAGEQTESSDGSPPFVMILEKEGTRLSLAAGDPNVLSGHLAKPDFEVVEIRKILYSLSLMFICRWRDAEGREWRDMPVLPEMMEMMGMNPTSLSDSDRAAIAASYTRQQVFKNLGPQGPSATRSGCLGLLLVAAGVGGVIFGVVFRA